jgi:hypothetical protein
MENEILEARNIRLFYDNKIYLQCNKTITDEDLEFVILFFETSKYSNGGDIMKFNYDISTNIIDIEYRCNMVKQEINFNT